MTILLRTCPHHASSVESATPASRRSPLEFRFPRPGSLAFLHFTEESEGAQNMCIHASCSIIALAVCDQHWAVSVAIDDVDRTIITQLDLSLYILLHWYITVRTSVLSPRGCLQCVHHNYYIYIYICLTIPPPLNHKVT
jgi:hypothetical protein